MLRNRWLEGDENESRTQLRNAEVACVQTLPIDPIAKLLKTLKDDSAGLGSLDKFKGYREEVADVLSAKLLPRDGEWGTWDAPGKEVYALVVRSINLADILLQDVPLWPVLSQGLTSGRVNLNGSFVVEASPL
jgi:hypothetical protein